LGLRKGSHGLPAVTNLVSQGWTDSLRDIDTVLEHLFSSCHEAKKDCRLYRDGDGVEDVKARFMAVIHRLERDPIVLIGAVAQLPTILTLSLVRQLLFAAMYSPMSSFPLIALLADILYRGEDPALLVGGPDLVPICGLKQKLLLYPDDSQVAIGCGDWAMVVRLPLYPPSPTAFKKLTNGCLAEKLVFRRCGGGVRAHGEAFLVCRRGMARTSMEALGKLADTGLVHQHHDPLRRLAG